MGFVGFSSVVHVLSDHHTPEQGCCKINSPVQQFPAPSQQDEKAHTQPDTHA